MTKLFRDLGGMAGQAPSGNHGNASDFIAEAQKQGFKMTVPDFFRFAKMAEGKDMGEVVRELRESGAIDEKQFQDLKNKATGFMSLIKMVTGK